MATGRISIRVDPELHLRLESAADAAGKSESELVRAAIEEYLERNTGPLSCYEVFLAAGAIGCVDVGPTDMSTNPKHLEGFGHG